MGNSETPNESTDKIAVHTSQEIDILSRATASGKTLRGYEAVSYGHSGAEAIRFSQPAITHVVEVSLTEEERRANVKLEHLHTLIQEQDSDAVLAQLYILSVLAPPPPEPSRGANSGWIDFDDVIEKIGWSPRSFTERREMHLRISEFLRFGERAQIVGERSVPYVDKKTRTTLDTYVRHSIWRIVSERAPEQSSLRELATDADRAPVAAELVISEKVVELITSPLTAQYLPMGEVLGAIPGNRASGAWARVIGLALMSFWRRHPENSLSGLYKPTRGELLTHFPPKVAPPETILSSKNPIRAIEYWHNALDTLVKRGILAKEGEAAITASEAKKRNKGYSWQPAWLNERVELLPAEELRAHIEGRAGAVTVKKLDKKKQR